MRYTTYRGTDAAGEQVTDVAELDIDAIEDMEHIRALAADLAERTGLTDVQLLHVTTEPPREDGPSTGGQPGDRPEGAGAATD
jgi:hypothetical protein